MSPEDRTQQAHGPPGPHYPASPPTAPSSQPPRQQPYPGQAYPGQAYPGQPYSGPAAAYPGYGYPPVPLRGPAPWSGPKMFFVVYGWAILAGVLVGVFFGVLVGGGLSALFGSAFQGMDQTLQNGVGTPGLGGFVSAGIGLGILFGGSFGFGLAVLFGAVAAAIATLTHTRMSPATAALVSAGIPSLLFGLAMTRTFVGGSGSSAGGLIALVIGAVVMFIPLFPIAFSSTRRSARAARGVIA